MSSSAENIPNVDRRQRSDTPLTWRHVRAEAEARLGPARGHEVRWLIERASGFEGAEHELHVDDAVAERHLAFFDQMLERRLTGEPLQYVLGRWQFRSLELYVDRRVLIPRPETEVVAGLAIDALRASSTLRALDLGTGSGAIALSLAAEVGGSTIWATDSSADALAVARANLAGLGGRAAARVTLLAGDWFGALGPELRGTFDVIVSNPPYVADGAPLPAEVQEWEPRAALRSGRMGLDALTAIIEQCGSWLAPRGTLVVEHSPEQSSSLLALASAAGLRGARVERDLAGRERALLAQRAS